MRKKITVLLIIVLMLALMSCTIINENEAGIVVANKNLPSVLELICTFQASESYATGFIIDENGYVLTNAHVVTSSVDNFIYDALSIKGKFYNSNAEYHLDIIKYDSVKDLALLKFKRNDLTLNAVEVGNSENLEHGATVFALGNAEGNGISMTKGIVSIPKIIFNDKETNEANEYIQTNAAVNSGCSGGPILNIKGQVIGMVSFKIKKTDVEGIGFAIPSRVFMNFLSNNSNNPARTIVEE